MKKENCTVPGRFAGTQFKKCRSAFIYGEMGSGLGGKRGGFSVVLSFGGIGLWGQRPMRREKNKLSSHQSRKMTIDV